jgi:hypothetical protein
MSNPLFKEVKIGCTCQTPEDRCRSLSVACPRPFVVEWWAYVEQPYDVERFLHRMFHEYRVSGEFFNLPVGIIRNGARSLLSRYRVTDPLEDKKHWLPKKNIRPPKDQFYPSDEPRIGFNKKQGRHCLRFYEGSGDEKIRRYVSEYNGKPFNTEADAKAFKQKIWPTG